jgi:autoinducer 2 (AI-2) kinase
MEDKAAALPPGANGVVGLFSNVMQADHWSHSSPGFLGFDVTDPSRSGRVECFRAIEESAAYVSLAHMRIIEELTGHAVTEVTMTGGAAKGRLWVQIVADTLGLPVQVPLVKESTALGAAICAGVGAGFWTTSQEAAASVAAVERTVTPNAQTHAVYRELAEQWFAVYRRSMSLVDPGLLRPLWRAAGT